MSEVESLKSNNDVQGLIQCLARRDTMVDAEQSLVEFGAAAVEPMAEALQDLRRRSTTTTPDSSADWNLAAGLIRSLGRIGDRRAVLAIVWWDPIPEWSPEQRRELVKDRKQYLKDPVRYDDRGYVKLWKEAKGLTQVWVEALIGLGGPEAEKALGGPWGLP